MPEAAPNPELLHSLGQLVRGLSALFWGLPVALVVCVQTSQADYLRMFGVLPPVMATGVLVYGLALLGRFRQEEAVWVSALDRAQFLALLNFGLSPFLFWSSRVPSNLYFALASEAMAGAGLLLLLALSPVLRRLTAMLPDEALRHETILFTRMNSVVVGVNLALVTGHFVLHHLKQPLRLPPPWPGLAERAGQYGGWFLILLAVAMTMALIWKTKEVIFHSVFGGSR
jgi:hypothetical protein